MTYQWWRHDEIFLEYLEQDWKHGEMSNIIQNGEGCQQNGNLAVNVQFKKIENETQTEDFKVWEVSELQVAR